MKDRSYTIYNTFEYEEWLDEEQAKSQVQIRARIAAIQDDGHFGDHKNVEDGVCELRWKNGRRVYYAVVPERQLILLLGGNKNGQDKDIRQAKKIVSKYIAFDRED